MQHDTSEVITSASNAAPTVCSTAYAPGIPARESEHPSPANRSLRLQEKALTIRRLAARLIDESGEPQTVGAMAVAIEALAQCMEQDLVNLSNDLIDANARQYFG